MKKKLSILSLLLGLFVCATVFSACGGDGDEPSSGGNSGSGSSDIPQTSKHIVKIISWHGDSMGEMTLTYDLQGRVTEFIETVTKPPGYYSRLTTTYQYSGETSIVKKQDEKETLSNGQSFSYSETHLITLENGRIVKDEAKGSNGSSYTDTFSYDSNNYLSSIDSNIITWSDGNLTKIASLTCSYSNYSWVKGFPLSPFGGILDAFLFSIGYYGNIPKNLPSKDTNGATYDYTLEGNYVTKVVKTPLDETEKNHKTTAVFFWE